VPSILLGTCFKILIPQLAIMKINKLIKEVSQSVYQKALFVRDGIVQTFQKKEENEHGIDAQNAELSLQALEENPALELYYMEGKKLFNQGEFAHRKHKYKSDLGIYL
jgi:hypothetical protein